MSRYPVIIGRFEKIDVVDLIDNVPAKVDTGAYRSSIHATGIRMVRKNNKDHLRFTILGHDAHGSQRVIETTRFTTRKVTSSNGHSSERYEVRLKMRLGYKVFVTAFTLSDRSNNVFPVLIGRKALSGRYLVDTARAGISRKDLRKAAQNIDKNEEDLEGVSV